MDQIVEILEQNGRASVKDIASMTGRTQKEIDAEIKSLEKKGVIVKYKAVINPDLIEDKKVRAIIEVKVSPQKNVGFDAVASHIYKYPEVKDCYLLSGGHDLHIVVEGDDLHAIANFVSQKLAPLDHVQSTATHFLLKKYKEDGVVLKKNNGKRINISY